MTRVKVEFDSGEAMSVSCAIGEYFRRLEKRAKKINPNDKLAKRIVKDSILELGTAYGKLEKAIQER